MTKTRRVNRFLIQSRKRKFLAFDLETAKVQPRGFRNWKAGRPLGISCAATLTEDSDKPVLWHGTAEHEQPGGQMTAKKLQALISYLTKHVNLGYTVVTWNGVGFDFDILAEESRMLQQCKELAFHHVDMMFHLVCKLGYGVSLDSAAQGMNMPGKCRRLDGALIPRLWDHGKWEEVLDYVSQDVRITLDLAKSCEESGCLRWISKSGRRREIRLPSGWLTVEAAERLPEPNAFWCSSQWARNRITAWMRRDG
jgi:RNase_H superfamily